MTGEFDMPTERKGRGSHQHPNKHVGDTDCDEGRDHSVAESEQRDDDTTKHRQGADQLPPRSDASAVANGFHGGVFQRTHRRAAGLRLGGGRTPLGAPGIGRD